jgi:hypothetical protein
MRYRICIAAALAALLVVTGAEAKNGKSDGNSGSQAGGTACPPGLAKKDPPCIPPGQAKGGETNQPVFPAYVIGQTLSPDYVIVLDPLRYMNWSDGVLAVFEGNLYRISRGDGHILDLLGPLADWQWRWDDVDFTSCPPGLAKKNPPCVPPGQARKAGIDPFKTGDRLPDGRIIALDPGLFGRDDNIYYARYGDTLYRIARDSGQVVTVIGPIGSFGN